MGEKLECERETTTVKDRNAVVERETTTVKDRNAVVETKAEK